MIYKCSKCLYLFERRGAVDRCPNCGGINFTEAGAEDQNKYDVLREEMKADREGKAREKPE